MMIILCSVSERTCFRLVSNFKITRIRDKTHFVRFLMQFVGLFDAIRIGYCNDRMECNFCKSPTSVFCFFHCSCCVIDIIDDNNFMY